MYYILSISFSLVFVSFNAYSVENHALSDFHLSIIDNIKKNEEAPSQDILNSQNPHIKPYAAVVNATKWPSAKIPVCWENPSPDYAKEMEWTREAIRMTWEVASSLEFTGWEKCAAVNNGIRILIADMGPHVKTLGMLLNRMENGMVLNFTFKNWSQSCQSTKEHCIRAIAVHEFGHAIGLTHEQNRADAPGECRFLAQGSNPDTTLTPYDPASVMNYCNKAWNNNGFLSVMDITAVQTLYGKP